MRSSSKNLILPRNSQRAASRPCIGWVRLLCSSLAIVGCTHELIAADAAGSSTPVTPTAVPAYRQANHVAVLTVRGVIDGVTEKSLERRMKEAVDAGADAVVLDIDTPGGLMDATLNICNLLKSRSETPPNVVAWINPTAYSAGTIIALACREIVVAPGATFGDAAPIQITPLGIHAASPTERAKMLAPILTEITDSAQRNHYDQGLIESFVRLGDSLWLLENSSSGERVFVDRNEYVAIFGDEPPAMVANQAIVAAPSTSPGASPTRSPVRPAFDAGIPRPSDQAGLSEAQRVEFEEFVQALPSPRAPLSAADRDQWRLVRQVVDGNTLLTVRSDEAVYYGLATTVIANDRDLQTYFGASGVTRYDESWSESMVRFLVSLPVRAVLIIVFLIALFIEMAAPGMGVFGALAAVALLVLIGAPYLAGMAQWWEVLLIVVGIGLVLTELLLIPGTTIAGVAGVLCLLIGLVSTFVSGDITSEQGQTQMWTGLATTLTSIFAAGVGMWIISRQLHSFPIMNRLILHEELRQGPGGSAPATGLLQAMGSAVGAALRTGDVGVAETDLRPAGRANFGGRLVDVQSAGTYIHRGAQVQVVSTAPFVIEVEEVIS